MDLFDFLLSHWQLTIIAVVLVALIVLEEKRSQGSMGHSLSPLSAVNKINEGALIIDIRDRPDYEAGHLANAQHAHVDDVAGQIADWVKKHGQVLLVCYRGRRSLTTLNSVVSQSPDLEGKIFSMAGGMTRWRDEGYPVVREQQTARSGESDS